MKKDWAKWAFIMQTVLIAAGVSAMWVLSEAGMAPEDAFNSGLVIMFLPLIVGAFGFFLFWISN